MKLPRVLLSHTELMKMEMTYQNSLPQDSAAGTAVCRSQCLQTPPPKSRRHLSWQMTQWGWCTCAIWGVSAGPHLNKRQLHMHNIANLTQLEAIWSGLIVQDKLITVHFLTCALYSPIMRSWWWHVCQSTWGLMVITLDGRDLRLQKLLHLFSAALLGTHV